MSIRLKRLFYILKNLSFDTHLWCISVIGAAILLSVSFFNDAFSTTLSNEEYGVMVSGTDNRVIEYSSFLGRLNLSAVDDTDMIKDCIPTDSMDIKGFDSVNDAVKASGVSDVISDKRIRVEEISLNSEAFEESVIEEDFDYVSGSLLARDEETDIDNEYKIDELELLARVIQCEAMSEDEKGRMLIANVVLNRVKTGIWGSSIKEVLMADGQFDPVENGAYMVVKPDDVTWSAVHRALSGEDSSMGATYFRRAKGSWGTKEYLFSYGAHSFYK